MRFENLVKKFLGMVRKPVFRAVCAVVSAGMGLGVPAWSAAGVIELPQTGQTKCYKPSTNAEITCSSAEAVGQDGYAVSGAAWPDPRFTNLDGSTPVNTAIVLDKLTGLQWTRYADTQAYLTCSGGKMDWASALSYVACLNTDNYLGHNDWRLPNILELASLISSDAPDQSVWLNSKGFINVQPSSYWSSTTYAYSTGVATSVNMEVGYMYFGSKTSYIRDVWPVRGGQTGSFVNSVIQLPKTGQTTCYDVTTHDPTPCSNTFGQDGNIRAGVSWPNPRFTINDLIVKDNLTGLVWLRDADCANGAKTWPEALSWAGNLQAGQCGLNDGSSAGEWRLPNVTELLSLIDFEYSQPPISATDGISQLTNLGDPFINVQTVNAYSTATTDANFPTKYIRLWAGIDGVYDRSPKTNPLFVWPVFDNRKKLSASYSGSGTGTIFADCSSGCWYPKNSTASLTAIPASGSYFAWWSGGCSGFNALTTTAMDASKTCNVLFNSCASPPIKNLQSVRTFTAAQGISGAYNDDYTCFFGRKDTLALLMSNYSGDLAFNLNKNIILQGGWDCGQTGRWLSPAFINGTITISNGSVVFDGIVIL